MKIAVTGAQGFVAKYLLEYLRKDHEVIGITRNPPRGLDDATGFMVSDYSVDSLQKCFVGCAAVVHLASQRPTPKDDFSLLANAYRDACVFESALRIGADRVVYMSSRSVYGRLRTPWLESAGVAPESFYALAKVHGEQIGNFFVKRGLSIASLRLAQIFGAGEHETNVVGKFVSGATRRQPAVVTVTGLVREYIYVRDVVRAVASALSRRSVGEFNVGSGEVVSVEELARIVYKAFGCEDLVVLSEAPEVREERSLMDSQRFYQEFDWRPQWTLVRAAEDIAAIVHRDSQPTKGLALEQHDY